MKVTKVELEVQDAADIVTTAIEGGINYWGECKGYDWKSFYENYDDEKYLSDQVYRDIQRDEVLVWVREDVESSGDEPQVEGNPWVGITIQNLEDALCKMLSSKYSHLINIREDDTDFDATAAEVVFQFVVFGDVIFG